MSEVAAQPAGAPATPPVEDKKRSKWFIIIAVSVLVISLLSAFRPFSSLEDIARAAAAITAVPTAHGGGGEPLTPSANEGTQQQQQNVHEQSGGGSTSGGVVTAPSPAAPSPAATSTTPDYLKDTAMVTLAMGDEAARLAVAWARSLRDVNTEIPNLIVLLSRGGIGSEMCHDGEWKKSKAREHIRCDGPDTIAEEIISEKYIKALNDMGVKTQVIDPLPDTPYLVIPGGRSTFWGAAVSKLRVFDPEFLPYRKVLWADADTIYLKNVDHLLKEPMFTAAFTYACCNANGPPAPSGGLWVVEPSREIADKMYKLTQGPVPGTEKDVWHWGDMQSEFLCMLTLFIWLKHQDNSSFQPPSLFVCHLRLLFAVVRYLFGAPPAPGTVQPLWPSIEDGRHGYVEGLELLPEYEKWSEKEMSDFLLRMPPEKRVGKGFLKDKWDGVNPKHVWKALNVLYDQCIGNCECLPGRDIPNKAYSVHFSCIQHLQKPSQYKTDKDFKEAMYNYATSCSRFWFMKWLDYFERGMGGEVGKPKLPAPYYEGPAIPIYDAKHDEVVRANRLRDGKL
jgi:hypothetical protein